ncbi:hypothetical protein B0H11DRAFT_2062857 [Mycena galericulata]|nr:hypothetical protein B0H11DRAFT_2062857 [Mycena galericulata]
MSEDASPPAKRQRTADSDSSSGSEGCTRSDIWMPFGDIILQAESTQFRVNRDVLARNSLMFHGMFTMPQPAGEAQIEGCPIVKLEGDAARDVELLLTAFYDPFYRRSRMSIDVVACNLRLGRKYEALSFKQDAMLRMHNEFPARLELWDRRMAANHTLDWIQPRQGVLIDLLNVAYENGVYTSIPALAFRCLSQYTLAQLFAGVERDDGSRAMLPDATKVVLAQAQEAILMFQRENLQWLREEEEVVPSQDCEVYDDCTEHRKDMYRIECRPDRVDLSYTLAIWNKVGDGSWVDRLCKECEPLAKAQYEVGRLKAWEKLPTFFGLPEWKDLKDMD